MPFPCEILKVSGSDALTQYEKLKANSGIIPVILGDDDDLASLTETMAYVTESYLQLLQQADSIDALEWFAKRQAQDAEYYDLTQGEWQDLAPTDTISAHLDLLTGEPKTAVYIALVPVAESCMLPAFLKIGGWNDCPTAAEHCAIFKYWNDCYGIRVAAIARDIIEVEVQRPPNTKEQALKLAEQQFIYCPDIVYQGTETIARLAAGLLNSRVWFFWWD